MNNNNVENNSIITFRLNALEDLLIKISSRLECLEEKINLFRSDIEYFTEIMVIDRNERVEQNKTIVYNELDITTNVNY